MRLSGLAPLLPLLSLLSSPLLIREGAAHELGRDLSVVRIGPTIREGIRVLPPPGFVRFCSEYPSECGGPSPALVSLSDEGWLVAVAVNDAVNREIRPEEDVGPDHWQLGVNAGDCDDYAAEKRHRLIAAGFPANALRFAVARTTRGEDHLLLVIRSDRGDLVLDNIDRDVRPASQIRHHLLIMQGPTRASGWAAAEIATTPTSVILASRAETDSR